VGGITKSNLSPIPLNPCHLSLSFLAIMQIALYET
jgi:hypothetical protein